VRNGSNKSASRDAASNLAGQSREATGTGQRSRKTKSKGETSMAPLVMEAGPSARATATKLQALRRAVVRALEQFTAAKICNAVPEHELRRAQRAIDRYRRLIHADNKPAAKEWRR
jgi:hypothetical protein